MQWAGTCTESDIEKSCLLMQKFQTAHNHLTLTDVSHFAMKENKISLLLLCEVLRHDLLCLNPLTHFIFRSAIYAALSASLVCTQ